MNNIVSIFGPIQSIICRWSEKIMEVMIFIRYSESLLHLSYLFNWSRFNDLGLVWIKRTSSINKYLLERDCVVLMGTNFKIFIRVETNSQFNKEDSNKVLDLPYLGLDSMTANHLKEKNFKSEQIVWKN